MLVMLNVPSIFSTFWFGPFSDWQPYDNAHSMAVLTVIILSVIGSCMLILLFGEFASTQSAGMAFLTLISILSRFFAGGYSIAWGGIVKEIERERNEAE